MENCDILLLQEHWLLNYEASILTELFDDHLYSIKCVDDRCPDLPLYRRRGSAGVAAVWSKDFDHLIEPLPDGSDRILILKISARETPLLLINTYMPTNGSKDPDYADILDEVNEILLKYKEWDLVWTGDINADTTREASYQNDRMLREFMEEHHLTVSSRQPTTPTYFHFMGSSTSRLDYFMERSSYPVLREILVDSRHTINTSSHDAVLGIIEAICNPKQTEEISTEPACPNPRHRWDKIDLMKYKELTEIRLGTLSNCISDNPLDVTAEMLNTVLERSAVDSSPAQPRKRGPRKNPWTPQLKPIVKDIKFLYHKMKNADTEEDRLTLSTSLKVAKKLLRRTQRQTSAKRRKETKLGIIAACKSKDKREFFKLIKKQRSSTPPQGTIDFGTQKMTNTPDSWARYFKQLATPKKEDSFDEEHGKHLEIMHLLRSLKPGNERLPPVTADQVSSYIKSLKNGKSPDLFGISSEHIKMAAPVVNDIILHICNKAIRTGTLPLSTKMGIVSPVLKKGKNHKDPNNYRRITISSVVGKVIEKHLLHSSNTILGASQSSLQFGFTEGCSPMAAALMVTELLAEAKENKSTLFLTFMDSSKAFDVVNHDAMLKALFEQGIRGQLWSLYDSMYSGIESTVKWGGRLSKAFQEEQGIRQGGITSPALYKAGRNRGLQQLQDNPTLHIGSHNVGAIMVADDLALAASADHEMQKALLIAEADASREHFLYNTTKTKTIIVNSRKVDSHFTLNSRTLGTSQKEKHLGIIRNCKNNNIDTVEARIKEARRASYSLMGAGLCGLNGVGPEVAIQIYITYVIPYHLGR